MKHFWAGFEKRAGKATDYATNVGANAALGGGIAYGINNLTKHRTSVKGSAALSGALAAVLGLPKLLRKEGANNRLFASGGMKALNRGNSVAGTMTARPTTLKATVGRTDPPQIPSAAAHTPKPAVPAPPHAPVKVPTIKAKGVTGMAV